MARVNPRQVQSYLYLWERKLLDRIRLIQKSQRNFIVLFEFSDDRVLLHWVNKDDKEKIVLTKGLLTKDE